ncbi:MAG: histidine triad nucleotide-binding protein [Nitrospinota bacterium]|nr:histidine triad nucleotide-binding protein [Nitrospinota bacterium]
MDCLFCKIINGEIPSKKIYEDNLIFAFEDIDPVSPIHALIIPKKHFSTILEIKEENSNLISAVFMAANKIAEQLNLNDSGFRIVTNCMEDGGQTVFHVHFHLLAGRKMLWPPG